MSGCGLNDPLTELARLARSAGDSDRLTTECAIVRAGQRFARAGRINRVAWAPAGRDFNDVLRSERQLG